LKNIWLASFSSMPQTHTEHKWLAECEGYVLTWTKFHFGRLALYLPY